MNKLYLLLLLVFLTIFSFAADLTGKVVKVIDGDTITILCNQKMIKIRLADIDSPEKGQPFGKAAKQFTSENAFGKVVTVQTHGHDKYGRTIGTVILPDESNLNRELVKAGYAWWYRKYSKDASIGELEKEARDNNLGLWADKDPVPPWVFRHNDYQRQISSKSTKAYESHKTYNSKTKSSLHKSKKHKKSKKKRKTSYYDYDKQKK